MKEDADSLLKLYANQDFISKDYLKYLVYEKHKTPFLNLRDITKRLK